MNSINQIRPKSQHGIERMLSSITATGTQTSKATTCKTKFPSARSRENLHVLGNHHSPHQPSAFTETKTGRRQPPLKQTYLCFACDGGHVTDFLGTQRVYHRALANIWIANEADTDLLLVCVQLLRERTHHGHAVRHTLRDRQVTSVR